MNPIKTLDQFLGIILNVLDGFGELKAAIEYDEEFMRDAMVLVSPIEKKADVRLLPFGQ